MVSLDCVGCRCFVQKAKSSVKASTDRAKRKLLSWVGRGDQLGPPQESAETQRGCKRGDEGERMREKELPLVLSRRCSKVTALAGGIWATAGGK